jgi:hypothetical protein
MAGLKSFLYGVAALLGTTGAALYERQRALVALGGLQATVGRGPGSGVPLTPEAVAAILISVLAAESLTEVDERVVRLINAPPQDVALNVRTTREWTKAGKPVFGTAVAAALAGRRVPYGGRNRVLGIRVTRWYSGQLIESQSGFKGPEFYVYDAKNLPPTPISITAEIKNEDFENLVSFCRGAFSQAEEEPE